jgi:hypothetical protein
MLGRTCADLAAFASRRRTRPNRTALASLVNAPHFRFRDAGALRRGSKATKADASLQAQAAASVYLYPHDEYSTSITDSRSSGDRSKPEQTDAASTHASDTMVRGARAVVRYGRAKPLLLAGNAGTTLGVHAGRAETLQCVHPRRRSDHDLPQGEKLRAQRCLQNGVRRGREPATQRK